MEDQNWSDLNQLRRAQYVQNMFTRIAPRYDLMNRLMTMGQDIQWRREVIRLAALPPDGRLLDLGAGTGDLGREARRQHPACLAVAADFTLEMMRVGRQNLLASPLAHSQRLEWSSADALHLPFPDGFFDAVVSGFLLRNVTDLPRSLAEQFRVIKPGGRIVALDTTPPPRSVLTPLINFHLHTIIPTIGRLLTGQPDAYQYLPETTQNFLPPQQLAARLMAAGFSAVGYQRRMFSTIAIYWGTKPNPGSNIQ